MKTIVCRISVILLLLVTVCGVKAQDADLFSYPYDSISKSGVITYVLPKASANHVDMLFDYISFIANRSFDYKTRLYYSYKALDLFVSQSNAYNEIINGVKIEHEGVEMEVISANNAEKNRFLIREYLPRMAALEYDSVKIQTTEIAKIKVSALKKIDENLYSCTCYIDQVYAGQTREGMLTYIGRAPKRVECFIFMEETLDGIEYTIRLGNVTAESIQRATSVTEALKKISL